jgi:hypothetical protein
LKKRSANEQGPCLRTMISRVTCAERAA